MKIKYRKLVIILILYWSCLFFQSSNNFLNGNNILSYQESQQLNSSSDGSFIWPTINWTTSSPEMQGVDSQKLNEMDNLIQSSTIRFNIDSLLIIRNGYLIYETYPSTIFDADDTHHLFSVTKSFTSTLIGIAIDKGYIDNVNDYVLEFFPYIAIDNMNSWKEEIRIKHLLTMTTGLQWSDTINFDIMWWGSNDSVQYILNQPMIHPPGSIWNYNTGASHLLSAILNQVTPNGTLTFAEEFLFNPLGITDYVWYVDSQGIPNGGALLYLKPRDMAKLGYLYLMGGQWENQQIVSREWTIQASKPSILFPSFDGPLTGYGYQWWGLFWGKVFAARGSYQQNIFIIPDLDIIVVTTGSYDFDPISLLVNYIFPATGYIVLNPYITLLIFVPVLSLLFIIPFLVNNQSLKRKLRPR
ncbi:MAG: serine hydrolase domain-containing protein [Candidatus Odinarchaeota archaeon]